MEDGKGAGPSTYSSFAAVVLESDVRGLGDHDREAHALVLADRLQEPGEQ